MDRMLEITDREGIRSIRMAHGKANAFDVEFCGALTSAFRDAGSARAVVLTGTGRIFSAGVDLPRILAGGEAYTRQFLGVLDECFRALFALERPVVAAINGHAIAGGCVLACACDARLMADGDATIGAPELAVGVPFPVLPLEILRHAGGDPLARRLSVRCESLPARAAFEAGLVDRLVPAAELEASALAEAQRLSAIPSPVFALAKRQLRAPVFERVAALKAHDEQVVREWTSPGVRASIAAFVERTLRKKS